MPRATSLKVRIIRGALSLWSSSALFLFRCAFGNTRAEGLSRYLGRIEDWVTNFLGRFWKAWWGRRFLTGHGRRWYLLAIRQRLRGGSRALEPDRTGVKPGSLSDLCRVINFPKLRFPLLLNRQLHLPDRLDVQIKPDNASKVFLEHRECLVTGTYHRGKGGRSHHHGDTPHRGWNGWRWGA